MNHDASQPLPFLKNGVAQVAILVKDLDKTVENYWTMFGIGPWHFYTYGKPLVRQMSYHGRPADYKMRIALSQIGPLRIELIEAREGDSIYADFIKEHGYGVHHLGILVDDGTPTVVPLHRHAGGQHTDDGHQPKGNDRERQGHLNHGEPRRPRARPAIEERGQSSPPP